MRAISEQRMTTNNRPVFVRHREPRLPRVRGEVYSTTAAAHAVSPRSGAGAIDSSLGDVSGSPAAGDVQQ